MGSRVQEKQVQELRGKGFKSSGEGGSRFQGKEVQQFREGCSTVQGKRFKSSGEAGSRVQGKRVQGFRRRRFYSLGKGGS